DLVVALRFAGRGAAWLHVIGAACGLTYLGSLSIHAPFSLDRSLVPGLGYALGPAALLAAIELGRGERRATGGRPAEAREIPIPVPARATAAPAPPASPPRPETGDPPRSEVAAERPSRLRGPHRGAHAPRRAPGEEPRGQPGPRAR